MDTKTNVQEILAQVKALIEEIFAWINDIFAGLKKDAE